MSVMMPSRISLRRSCNACIAAKRRCDLQSPRCSRCVSRGVQCLYANEPSTAASAPQGHGRGAVIVSRVSKATATIPEVGLNHIAMEQLRRFWSSVTAHERLPIFEFTGSDSHIRHDNLLGPPKTLTLDPATMRYVIAGMREFPRTVLQLGRSSFIHSSLIDNMHADPIMLRIFALCGSYATSASEAHRREVHSDLLGEIDRLCGHVKRNDSLQTILLASQAMTMSAIILYLGTAEHPSSFDPQDSFQRQKHFNQLGDWTHRLWELAPWKLPDYLDQHSAWLFGESIRRTLLVSTILRDVSSVLDCGQFIFTGFVSVLPFDIQTNVWDERAGSMFEVPQAKLMSYRQLIDKFEGGELSIDAPGPWIRLLLVACRGYTRTVAKIGHETEKICPLVDDSTYLQRGERNWSLDPFRATPNEWVPSVA